MKIKTITILITFILFVFSININANDTTSVITQTKEEISNIVTNVDTSSLSKQIYSDFKVAMINIAEALKVGVENVFNILVKQQIVKSIVYICLYIFGFFLVIFCWKQAKKKYYIHLKECGWKQDDEGRSRRSIEINDTANGPASVVFGVLGGMIFLFMSIGIFETFNSTVTGFINPEYGAIMDIMNFNK